MKPTTKDVLDATKELQEAMIESIEAGQAEDDAKVRKMKAHYRLTMARDAVRSITFN